MISFIIDPLILQHPERLMHARRLTILIDQTN
jgi:hypothetical protein